MATLVNSSHNQISAQHGNHVILTHFNIKFEYKTSNMPFPKFKLHIFKETLRQLLSFNPLNHFPLSSNGVQPFTSSQILIYLNDSSSLYQFPITLLVKVLTFSKRKFHQMSQTSTFKTKSQILFIYFIAILKFSKFNIIKYIHFYSIKKE